MKKSFVKFVALALVLIMVLGAVPVSAASKTIENAGSLLNDMFSWLFMPIPQGSAFPEQEFLPPEVDGVTVTVRAPEGALPAGTDIEVAPVDMAAVQNAVDASSEVSGTVLAAVDITFRYRGEEIQPTAPVTVTMTSAALEGQDNLTVVHIDDLRAFGDPELIAADYEEDTVTFDAQHFSVYAVLPGGASDNLLTVKFWDVYGGEQTLINTQTIRMSKIDVVDQPVFDPGVPDITATQSFEGWAQVYPFTEETTGYSVEDINRGIKQQFGPTSASTTINCYAKVYDVRYVTYHDQAGAILMTQAFHLQDGEAASVKIEHPYVGFKSAQNFAGWVAEDKVEVPGIYPRYADNVGTVYQNGTSYDLSENLSLYPYLNTGNWLVFDANIKQDTDPSSASYTAPRFIAEGENTVAPANPTRAGYRFGGWYTDEGCTQSFIFGNQINEETHVYAKWIPVEANYTVVFWVQKITDTPTTADADKEYDFYKSTVRSAHTWSQVSINTSNSGEQADNRLGYNSDSSIGELGYYFLYNATNTDTGSVTVRGDGSTTLNVYYDRKVVTFKYYESDKTTPWTPSGGYVEATNGDYYYYTAQETGYYLIATGPNADYVPAVGDTIYYKYSVSTSYYTLEEADAYFRSNYPYFASSTEFNSEVYSPSTSGYDYRWAASGSLYERYQFSNNSYYSWIAYYYRFTENYATGYYPVGTGPTPTAPGTHNLTGGTGSNVISGLYGAQLGSLDWPNPGEGLVWANDDGSDSYNYPLALTEYVPVSETTNSTEVKFYLTDDSGATIHVWYVGQELNGTDYTVPLTDGLVVLSTSSSTRYWYPNETIHGFRIVGYRFGTSGSWTSATPASGITLPTSTSGGELYIAFARNTHELSFYSNNEVVTPENLPGAYSLEAIPYDTDLAVFMGAEPTNGPEGYFFDGWCSDPACTTPFDFDSNMPDNNLRLYAKWTMKRYRVVMDPTGGEDITNPETVISFPGGKQATSFRVDYGELIREGSLDNAIREGYTLLGWYLDPEFTKPFTFSMPMNDDLGEGVIDYTYGEHFEGETQAEFEAKRKGSDPWNTEAPYWNDNAADKANVIGKITIYARWRQDPDGVIGINVRYDATAKDGATGKFGDGTTVRNPIEVYADKARAFAQPAPTPDNPDLQFLYWEILDKNDNVVGKAYPGQLFDIHFEYAKEETLRANAVYTYGDPKPEALKTSAEVSTRESTRATHTYTKVATPVEGKKYLITYTTGNTAYMMSNTYYNNGSNRPLGVAATVSSNKITGDYDAYLFGVDKDSDGYYQFGNLNRIAYLGETTGYYPYYGDNNTTWELTSEGYLRNYEATSYRYLGFNNGSGAANKYFDCYGSGSSSNNSKITFYELEDEAITGETFDLTNDLHVGGRYIIAINDYAVGNLPLNSSSNDHFINGIRVQLNTSPASVTVPTAQVDSATWEIVSGDAANGFVFRNVGNGKYLGMSTDGKCYLAATTEAFASHWTYDNGTDLNNHVTESANASGSSYFYYLSFSGSFLDFTTATYTGHGVKFYSVSAAYNVTFMDGHTNTQIGAVQQVAEGDSAVAPEVPDHTDEGYIFTGWDTDFSYITGDTVVTAQYVNQSELSYTVTFRYMDSNGDWVTTSQTVHHNDPAVAPTIPTPPAGFTFAGWDKKFEHVTSNMTINAAYRQVATTKYVITLRAVYGLPMLDDKTFINWFANNSETNGGDLHKDAGLEFNAPVLIPTPDTFTVTTRDGEVTYPLKDENRIFLGWARIETTGSDTAGTAHHELNEDHIFLMWDAAAEDYVVMDKLTGVDDLNVGTHVSHVAADNMQPYHDMYAVWADVFYVYHSGNNTVEKVALTSKAPATYDLTANLTDGTLYGGYYTDYAFKSTDFDAKDQTAMGWTAIKGDSFVNGLYKETKNDPGTDKVAYTGAESNAWKYADALGQNFASESGKESTDPNASENGLAITPVAGRTYFVKEVPADKYLRDYLHYTYYTGGNCKIGTAWAISAVDDLNYRETGFVVIDNHAAKIRGTMTIVAQNTGDRVTLTPWSVFTAGATPSDPNDPATDTNNPRTSYLTYLEVFSENSTSNLLSNGCEIGRYWQTPDGLFVTGTVNTTYSYNGQQVPTAAMSGNAVPVDSTITVPQD